MLHDILLRGLVVNVENHTKPSKEKKCNITEQSQSTSLEELRFLISLEYQRNSIIENKAMYLLGFLAVIISIISLDFSELIFSDMILLSLICVSAILCLFIIRPTWYKYPHKDFEEFYHYVKQAPHVTKEEFITDLIIFGEDLRRINNNKVRFLLPAFFSVIITIAYTFLLLYSN